MKLKRVYMEDNQTAKYRIEVIDHSMFYTIAYDTETGVCYLFGRNCVTVMRDPEGKPLIYDNLEK